MPRENLPRWRLEEPAVLELRGGEDGDLLFGVKVELIYLFGGPIFLFCGKPDLYKGLCSTPPWILPSTSLPTSPTLPCENHMGQGMSQVLHLDSGRKLVRGGHGSFDGGEQMVVNPHTWWGGQDWRFSSLTGVWLWDACAQGSRFSCRLLQSNQHDNSDEAREPSDS